MAAQEWNAIYERLLHDFRIRTSPVAIKWFDSVDELKAIPNITFEERNVSPCLLIGMAARLNKTTGMTLDNSFFDYCATLNGLKEKTDKWASADWFVGRWVTDLKGARAHHAAMNVPSTCYKGIVAGPMQSGNISDPDVIGVYATPGQLFWIMSSLINTNWRQLDFTFTGESSCSNSWLQTKESGKPGIGWGTFGERCFAGQPEDELLLTIKPDDLKNILEGSENLKKSMGGYPIPPMGFYLGDPGDTVTPVKALGF